MKFYLSFLAISLLALKSLPGTTAANPADASRLENNGYSITVAIQSSVKEDSTMIDRLKKYMNATSHFMLQALDRRAYIKEVTVIVPTHWSTISGLAGRGQTYREADFQIGSNNSVEDWLPYLRQESYECGEPSSRAIYIPLEYFYKNEDCVLEHGEPEKKLTVLFARYRYGIFDESPRKNDAPYVRQGGKDIPNICSADIEGKDVKKGTDMSCRLEQGNFNDCEFKVDTSQKTATGSLLYSDKIKSVVKFCSSTSFGSNKHNTNAKNLQTEKCVSESAWEVINRSPDFKGINPPIANLKFDPTPTFKLVQDKAKHIAIIMDTSGSMSGGEIEKLITVGEYFIKQSIPNGFSFSLVDFDNDAVVTLPLTTINADSDRQLGISNLPTVSDASGGTCIDCGLRTGLLSLTTGGRTAHGHRLLILTDGIGAVSPSVTNEIVAAGLVVDTILFAVETIHPLQQLSEDTGGTVNFCSLGKDIDICLKEAFRKTIDERRDSDSLVSHLIKTGTIDGTKKTHSFIVDSTLGNDTKLEIYLPSLTTEVLTVFPPIGSPITQGNTQYKGNPARNTITVTFSGIAEAGRYTFELSNKAFSGVASWEVRSKIRSQTQSPITLKASHRTETKNGAFWLLLFGEIMSAFDPVVGVDVTAIVTIDNFEEHIQLRDDGLGADVHGNDGIYSGYFMNFKRMGKYTYHIIAKADSASYLVVKNHYYCSQDKKRTKRNADDFSETLEEAPEFQRESPGNFFEIDVPITGNQSHAIPPSKIKDLRIVNGTAETSVIVTLNWTAVGEDLDLGNATKYKMCYAEETSLLISNWSHCSNLNESHVIDGDLNEPQKARSRELFVIELPLNSYNEGVWSLAVAAVDKYGNEGEISNVVVSNIQVPPPTTTTEAMSTNPETHHEEEDIDITAWYQKTSVIGPMLAAIVITLLAIAGIGIGLGYRTRKPVKNAI